MKFTGVCCECQTVHLVSLDSKYRILMDIHDAFGSHCNGSKTVPQVLFDEYGRKVDLDPLELNPMDESWNGLVNEK